jgi:hypothetical protein
MFSFFMWKKKRLFARAGEKNETLKQREKEGKRKERK